MEDFCLKDRVILNILKPKKIWRASKILKLSLNTRQKHGCSQLSHILEIDGDDKTLKGQELLPLCSHTYMKSSLGYPYDPSTAK